MACSLGELTSMHARSCQCQSTGPDGTGLWKASWTVEPASVVAGIWFHFGGGQHSDLSDQGAHEFSSDDGGDAPAPSIPSLLFQILSLTLHRQNQNS